MYYEKKNQDVILTLIIAKRITIRFILITTY